MKFIQLIDYKTTCVGEVQDLLSQWIEETGGVRTATHTTVGRNRDDATHFIEILEFPSYEEAMLNSSLPETNRVHERFASLALSTRSSSTLTSFAMNRYRRVLRSIGPVGPGDPILTASIAGDPVIEKVRSGLL